MRLYIIRHADPDYENNTITPDGHKEAEALAKYLHAEGINKIYTSPIPRAKLTMEYTAKVTGLDYSILEWTRELWPDLVIEDTQWGEIFAIHLPGDYIRSEPDLCTCQTWHQCSLFDNSSVKKTYEELVQNSDEFLSSLGYVREDGRYRCKEPNQDKIAVFCHLGFGLTWLAHLLAIPPSIMWCGFWLPPSSVTTILFEECTPGWAVPRCIGLGETAHLYKENLPVKPRGIIYNFY